MKEKLKRLNPAIGVTGVILFSLVIALAVQVVKGFCYQNGIIGRAEAYIYIFTQSPEKMLIAAIAVFAIGYVTGRSDGRKTS